MDLAYEIATPAHISPILDLQEAFYAIDGYPFARQKAASVLLHFLQTPGLGKIYIIKMAPEYNIIGYLALTYGYSFEFGGNIAFLDEFFIKADFRSRGLGSQVLKYILEQAAKMNLRVLHLEAERQNLAGKSLYHKYGFRDHDRHLMTRVINPISRE